MANISSIQKIFILLIVVVAVLAGMTLWSASKVNKDVFYFHEEDDLLSNNGNRLYLMQGKGEGIENAMTLPCLIFLNRKDGSRDTIWITQVTFDRDSALKLENVIMGSGLDY